MASITDLYGKSAIEVAREILADSADRERRRQAATNYHLLHDDGADVLREAIRPLFLDAEIYKRVCSFAAFTDSQGLFARVINELARPVYSIPPTRTIDPEGDQQAFADLKRETKYDARMDLWLRFALCDGDAATCTRYVARLGQIRIDVIPAHAYSVVPHPDDPTMAAGYIMDMWVAGETTPRRCVCDDTERFVLASDGALLEAPEPHNMPRMPFVDLHNGERSGSYWNPAPSRALRAADLQCRLLNLLSLRLLKVRGFDKIVVSGDYMAMPKDQPLDEEGAIAAPDGVQVRTLGDRNDAGPYLALLDVIKRDAAANRGISRARLNQDKALASDDKGLEEARAELIRIMAPVEKEQVEVLAMVSQEHPTLRMTAAATLASIDYGELAHRVDRETQLKIRDIERKMGVRCVLDDLKEDNPEVIDDAGAWAELDRNLAAESQFIEARRALNIATTADVANPGQDPQQNGAMGRAVRDGRMTPGAARDMARNADMPEE